MARKKRVLVVDDSSSARDQLKAMIKGEHIEVHEATNGQMAHQMVLEAESFDLAFFDVNMPGMTGLDLAERLKSDAEAKRCEKFPVVMVTTENTMDKVLRGKAAGVVGWIVKPPKPEMVEQIVKKFVP